MSEKEISLSEIQKLYIDGRITELKFTEILIETLGEPKLLALLHEWLADKYPKDFLTQPLPEELQSIMRITE